LYTPKENYQRNKGADFSAPAAWPGEHGAPGRLSAHEGYRVAVTEHGVGREYSPFILPTVVEQIVRHYQEGIANEVLSVAEGMRQMTDKINLELSRTVQRDPRLAQRYRDALAKQERIDRLKAAGKPVGPEMIDNPVIRRLREAGK